MVSISVIMPLYNQANVVCEAVNSVINQTFHDWELIVIDDCSTDNSRAVVESIITDNSKIRLISLDTNSGSPILPRNRGISEARGEYILPLDADDVLYPTCLEQFYQAITMGLGDVVYSKVEFIGERDGIFESAVPTRREMKCRNWVVNTALFKKADWERYGGYDLNFIKGDEDWAFWLNFVEDRKDFYQIPEVLVKYRVSSSGRCLTNMSRSGKDNLLEYLRRKHKGLYARDVYYTLSLKDKVRLFFYSIFHGDKKVERKITSLAIPNLNPIKSPTIFMVMLVRNENDIIEKNIVFHKELGVDGIIVTDNGSDDGTRQTLERLKANGLITEVIDDPFAEYRQKELVHRMIMLAKRKYRADFIISVDADEFWFPKTRNFKETLSKFRGSLLYVPIYNMIDEGGYFLDNVKRICKEIPKAKIEDLVQRGCLAKYNQYSSQIPKVIIRASDYCYIANGNHNALVERPHRKIVSDDIKIYHFASRGVRQFERKNIDNGRRLARSSLDPNFGVHWRYFYDQFKCGVPIQSLYNKYIGKDCLLEFDGFCVEDQAVRNVLCLRDLKDGRFPELMSFREMLHKILAGCSMIRYGDAEFDIGFIQENKDDPYQKPSVRLTERLAKILAKNDPKILVCIPPLESEHNNIRNFRNSGFTFWEWYWVSRWERLSKYIDKKIYGNSFFSRDSVFYELSVSEISAIWNGRKVVFVYSREGRFVFDQRLFSGVKERFEVFIPATNAFDDYERILSECLKFPKDVLFFISAGPTACVLVDDLVNAGYQALDMGHFPNCYLQYLGESSAPELLPMDKSKLKKTK